MTAGAAPATTATPLVLSDAAVEHLAKARFWARLEAVFGFIYTGMLALGGALLAVIPRPPGGGPSLIVMVPILFGLAGLLALSSMLFWTYGGRLAAFGRGQAGALVPAFRSLRHIWILFAVSYGLSLLATVVLVVMKIVGAEVPGAGFPR